MILEVYAMKDTKIAFINPFLMQNRAVALRNAKWLANEKDSREVEDIQMYQLGTYDDNTGLILPLDKGPEYVCTLMDLRTVKNED